MHLSPHQIELMTSPGMIALGLYVLAVCIYCGYFIRDQLNDPSDDQTENRTL